MEKTDRWQLITFRVSKKQHKLLKEKARVNGLTVSELLRKSALDESKDRIATKLVTMVANRLTEDLNNTIQLAFMSAVDSLSESMNEGNR